MLALPLGSWTHDPTRLLLRVGGSDRRSVWHEWCERSLGVLQGDPAFMRRLNGWLTLFWVAMIPISYEFVWLKSVVYVSALSLWALGAGHWSTWQAARVEVTQQRENEKLEDSPIEERVVEKIVQDTALEPTP